MSAPGIKQKKNEREFRCCAPAAGQAAAQGTSTALAPVPAHDTSCLRFAVARGLVEAPGLDVLIAALDGDTICVKPVLGDLQGRGVHEARVTPVEERKAHTLGVVEKGGCHGKEARAAASGGHLSVVQQIAQDGQLVSGDEVACGVKGLEDIHVSLLVRRRTGET